MIGHTQLKRLYFLLSRALGGEGRLLRQLGHKNRLVVLNLHKVHPRPNPYWNPLYPALFEELLQFIGPRFRVTTFSGLHHGSDPRVALILSFDDGYYNYVEYALPLLQKYKLPSNQNVITNAVLSGQPPREVWLSDFLGQAPHSIVNEIRLPGFQLRMRDDSADEKTHYGNALSRFMKMRPRSEAGPLWDALHRVVEKFDGFRPSRMMTVAEIRQVASEHEIGCHSSSHASMEFESNLFFEQDFDRCEIFFRDKLKLPLDIYAFPNGSWRPELLRILERRKVSQVLLVGDTYASVDSTVYPRFTYYADSRDEARLRALGYTANSGIIRILLSKVHLWRNYRRRECAARV